MNFNFLVKMFPGMWSGMHDLVCQNIYPDAIYDRHEMESIVDNILLFSIP